MRTAEDLLKEARMVIHMEFCFEDLEGIWHDPTCQAITEYLERCLMAGNKQGGENDRSKIEEE